MSTISSRLRQYLKTAYFREIAWVAAGHAATLLASVVTIKYLTTRLLPASYGELNLILTAIVLPTWLFLAPVSQAALRWYSAEREKGASASLFITTLVAYAAACVGCFGVAAFGYFSGLVTRAGVSSIVLSLSILVFLADGWVLLGLTFVSAIRDRARYTILTTTSAWVRLALIILAGNVGTTSIESVLVAYALASFIVLGPLWRGLIKDSQYTSLGRFDVHLLGRMLAYGLPFGIWSCFAWGHQYFDRYAVDIWLGRHSAGTYIAAVQVSALPFAALGAVLSQFLTPVAYEIAGDGNSELGLARVEAFTKGVAKLFVIVSVPLVLVYFLGGNWILSLLTSKAFDTSSTYLGVLALGALATSLAHLLTTQLLVYKRSGLLLWAKICPGLLGVPITWLLIAKYGFTGAAVAYLITGLFFLCLTMYLVHRLTMAGEQSRPDANMV